MEIHSIICTLGPKQSCICSVLYVSVCSCARVLWYFCFSSHSLSDRSISDNSWWIIFVDTMKVLNMQNADENQKTTTSAAAASSRQHLQLKVNHEQQIKNYVRLQQARERERERNSPMANYLVLLLLLFSIFYAKYKQNTMYLLLLLFCCDFKFKRNTNTHTRTHSYTCRHRNITKMRLFNV